jgi:hypothetical protein
MLDLLDGFKFVEKTEGRGRGKVNKGIFTSLQKQSIKSGKQGYSLCVSIDADAMRKCGFAANDRVLVGFKEDGGNKYMFIKKSEKGFTLSPTSASSKKGASGFVPCAFKMRAESCPSGYDGINVGVDEISVIFGGALVKAK